MSDAAADSSAMKPPSRPPQPIPIAAISIPSCIYAGDDPLDRIKDNWYDWKANIERQAKMCHIWPYLTGAILRPDPDVDPVSTVNFNTNEQAIIVFLRSNAAKEEQAFMSKYSSVSELWSALCARHEEPKTFAQVLLLMKLFACRYVATERYPVTTVRIQELVDRIFNIGPPTADVLATAAMFNAMGGHLQHLQSQIGTALAFSSAAAPYMAVNIAQRLDFEQQVVDAKSSSFSANSLVAGRPGKGPRVCINPGCPHPNGHTAAQCFAAGGGMAGKRDERLAARKKARRGKGKQTAAVAPVSTTTSSATTACVDQPGRPFKFIVDKNTGKAYFLGVAPSPADSAAAKDTVSLNWAAQTRVPADSAASSAAPDPAVARRLPTVGPGPFLISSAASTHLSPKKADFCELRPITPRGIRDANGSVIYACGVGRVRLHIDRGASLVLDDVLYVPLATVRLVSVSALCNSASRYEVQFDDQGVRITKPDGSLVASGTLTSRRLYSLNDTPCGD
ncbi:hypothetical protein EVJ58_g4056 [Rhodofomes roseus]|uniref:Retrovirus-related Pol polyprotein from transposon TNT 1-94-like beta-barrel domain-containing protein n=1 Tax=Rhodofomes roseus TaxID=34475 RepID=A0A4Y9YHW0_9APHY|nr:hypothetical protein EVJ58_g4056 [Rhodofomes roseus]